MKKPSTFLPQNCYFCFRLSKEKTSKLFKTKADSFRVITHQLILRFVYLNLVKSQAKVSADEKYKKSGSFKIYNDLSLVASAIPELTIYI